MNKLWKYCLLIVCLFVSCKAQMQSPNFDWKEHSFNNAGIKIKFPCEVNERVVNLTENGKPVKFFTFDCDKNQISFLVQLWEYSDGLNIDQIQQKLDDEEKKLKADVGQNNKVENKDILYQNKLKGKIFNITNATTSMQETSIVSKKGLYKIVVFFPKPKQQSKRDFDNEFESVSKTFFESFQIIE